MNPDPTRIRATYGTFHLLAVLFLESFSSPAIRNVETNQCLDNMGRKENEKVGIFNCHGMGGNQHFVLRHINSNQCLDEPTEDDKMVPTMKECNGSRSQQWLLRNMTLSA
ncbi:hypothetical protein GDO81_022006 [Engystomops pustulosus]|uniref:Ricin B lectin domain-containing protein n=1 Tax=Engystomops pustulosus TaxID=76066 RepID=A0AAV6ZEN0_ENGPU|nr:hypothetical protein GDO81_022006 [Engystomops pustulosus]